MQNLYFSLHRFMMQMIPALSEEGWKAMQERLEHRRYNKRQTYLTEGKVCHAIAFVNYGSFRYYKVIDGIETTTYFSFENDWIGAYTSFLQQAPGDITVEALEESEVLMLHYEDLQYLYNHFPIFERFGRLMAEYLTICLDERMQSLLLKTPEERYLKALQDNPLYFERVPQHYIASYLGIAPESLSRIRRRMMQKVIS